jgi:drug/metabolite transporter (DMT)-like permease
LGIFEADPKRVNKFAKNEHFGIIQNMSQEIIIAILGGTGAMLGWGISDFFAKKTVDRIGDVKTLFWSQTFGFLPLLIYFLLNYSTPHITTRAVSLLVLYGVIDAFGYLFFYKALEKGKVSVVSPILATFAAFAVLISAFLFGERILPIRWLALGVVFAGIFLTSIDLKGLRSGSLDREDSVKGLPETFVGVVLFAIWFPLWDNFVSKGDWAFLVTALRAAVALTVLIFAKSTKTQLMVKGTDIWKLLVVIGILDGGAYLTLTWGFGATMLTSVVTMLSAAYSLPTLILARIFLKEKLTVNQWVGVLSIVGGLVLLAGTG